MRQILQNICQDTRGASAVEMALVLPLLLLLGLGTADYGNMLLQKHRMNTGLVAAGNYLARAENPNGIEAIAKNIAVSGNPAGATPRVKGWSASDVSIAYASVSNNGQYRGQNTVRTATLSSELTYTGFGLVTVLSPGGITMRAQYSERLTGERT